MADALTHLPRSYARSLYLVLSACVRHSPLLFATATLPVLVGWLAVTWFRLDVLNELSVTDGHLVRSWGDKEIPLLLDVLITFANGAGMPLAVGLTSLVWVSRVLGRRVPLYAAVGRLVRQAPVLLGWGLLVLLFCASPLITVHAFLTLTGTLPPDEDYGPIRLIVVVMGGIAIMLLGVTWVFSLPFVLLEGHWIRDAISRAKDMASDRWPELVFNFLLAVGLLGSSALAAAWATGHVPDPVTGVGLGLLVQGLLLVLVAPLGVLLLCVPVLLRTHVSKLWQGPDHLDVPAVLRNLPDARELSERHGPTGWIADAGVLLLMAGAAAGLAARVAVLLVALG